MDYGSTKQEERGRLLYSLEYDGAHSEVTKTAAGGLQDSFLHWGAAETHWAPFFFL